MSLLPDEGFESFHQTRTPISTADSKLTLIADLARTPLIEAKLRMPDIEPRQVPKRLTTLLDRSVRNHSGTLIVGRAGVGKTTLAADHCSRIEDHAWYTIDAADADWSSFSRYFRAVIMGKRAAERSGLDPLTPLQLFAGLADTIESGSVKWPPLWVLDSVHYLFDSSWFAEFFQLLIASTPPSAHVLILSRSRPTNPVWRLRSKRMLGVIDERVLSFSAAEAEQLFTSNGLDRTEGVRAHRESYGQAGKLIGILESMMRTAHAA